MDKKKMAEKKKFLEGGSMLHEGEPTKIRRAPSETPSNPYRQSAVSKSIARNQAKRAKSFATKKGLNMGKLNKALDDIFGKAGMVMDYISAPASRRASEKKGIQPKWKPGMKPKGLGRKG